LRADIALSHFSGPLPPPEQLAKYEQILPGAADRIMRMAEHQASHRQSQELAIVRSGIAAQWAGISCAFVIAMTAIVGGIWLSSQGMSAVGLTSIIAALCALVGTFIYGKSEQKKELRRKSELIEPPIHGAQRQK
jgi:uncharacterized membrane protein